MKINCGPTWKEREDANRQWHDWFAWFPVRVASRDCRWLETVSRRRRAAAESVDKDGNEYTVFWSDGFDYRSKA